MGIVFKVDNTAETEKCAAPLANKFQINNIRYFNDDRSLLDQDFAEVVCLGHTELKNSRIHYGKYTPDTFVKQFNALVLGKLPKGASDSTIARAKQAVKHLYLVGCEVGLTRNGSQSFAQEVADLLEKEGYGCALVHAVSNPLGTNPETMTVEVLVKPIPGILKVTYGSEQSISKLEQLSNALSQSMPKSKMTTFEDVQAHKAQREQFNAQKQRLNAEKNALEDDHTHYISGDLRESLQIQIHRGPLNQHKAKENAVRVIQQLRDDKKKNSKKYNALNELYKKVSAASGAGWQDPIVAILEDEKVKFEKHGTRDSLKELLRFSAPVSTVKNHHSNNSSDKDDAAKPFLESTRSQNLEPIFTGRSVSPPPSKDDRRDILKAIDSYVNTLANEAAARSCLSFFGHLGKYKLSRFKELQAKVQGLQSIDDIKKAVRELFNSSTFIASGSTHRAENLAANILHGDYTKGTDTPTQALDKNDLKL